jgi:hypothetical protein
MLSQGTIPTPKKRKGNYFWQLPEKVEFVRLLHKHGKKWILISKELPRSKAGDERNQQQCRSHG